MKNLCFFPYCWVLDEESEASVEEGDRRPGHFEMVQDYQNNVYHLPSHPKPMDYVLFIPKAILYFFMRLTKTFGLKVIEITRIHKKDNME